MAFSFNWAGLTAPRVDPIKDEVDLNAMGQALGKGLRGYRNRVAAEEYADAIDRYRKGTAADDAADRKRISAIQQELERLNQENAYIDSILKEAGPQPTEMSVVERADTIDPEYARQLDLFERFDPKNPKAYSMDDIKAVQSFIGVPEADIDGKWGPQSQGYWDNFTRNYNMI